MSRQAHGQRRGWWMLLLALMIPGPVLGAGFSEYELKAAFIYNFAAFADWPPSAPPGMDFCVIGRDPFGRALDALKGKLVKGVSVSVRRIQTVADARRCHVLFISASEVDNLEQLLAAVKDLPVLTVADTEGAVRQGVIIGFAIENQRITFEVNTAAAHSAHIMLSSRLLKLARNVYPPP